MPPDSPLCPAPVAIDEAGLRLDKWLALRLPDLSRTRVKALIEEGCVRGDGGTITDPSQRVKPGQAVVVAVPPDAPAEPEAQDIELVVAYEDADLIVVDKPAGMVVHPAPGSPDRTLVNALLAHCGESLSGIGGVRRPGIVHRIDKDTSGLVVVAKNDRAHRALAEQFAVHSMQRAYWALVWGQPVPAKGTVSGNIGRSNTDRKKMAVVAGRGKPAVTHYRVLRTFAAGAVSLVECRLETGRTHQIRVHMTAIGHPLVGDATYGRGRANRLKGLDLETRRLLAEFPRQALHAYLLGFTHPTSGGQVLLESSMPRDINVLLKNLDTL
ncbi:MAG: RluA family pseudouridine synthase [Magnetospirillum sp.]|nr:RluA family pseudouridine synthase [Magnetospirillum sp.]